MWIDRNVYENLMLDNAKLREESRVLNQQNQTLRSSLEWFMVRVTQLEKERAVLVQNYMGVKIETPDYRPAPSPREVPLDIPSLIGAMGFNDMGDDEARRLGIDFPDAAPTR